MCKWGFFCFFCVCLSVVLVLCLEKKKIKKYKKTIVFLVDRANVEFAKLGLYGITAFASSGDAGAIDSDSECENSQYAPNYPASSPYVTGDLVFYFILFFFHFFILFLFCDLFWFCTVICDIFCSFVRFCFCCGYCMCHMLVCVCMCL